MPEIIHLHPNRLARNVNIFILLIPAIIFLLVLAFTAKRHEKDAVLGETTTVSVENESLTPSP